MAKREWVKSKTGRWNIHESGPYTIQRRDSSRSVGWFYEGEYRFAKSTSAAKAAIEQHAKDTQ